MAKKIKTEPEKKAVTDTAEANSAGNGSGAAATRKKARSAPVRSKGKKPAAKKTSAGPRRSSDKPSSALPREPSDEEIRTRAYFLAERRLQLSLPGDSAHDWIEARRQLIEEAGPASS